jgi:hypothetical protein
MEQIEYPMAIIFHEIDEPLPPRCNAQHPEHKDTRCQLFKGHSGNHIGRHKQHRPIMDYNVDWEGKSKAQPVHKLFFKTKALHDWNLRNIQVACGDILTHAEMPNSAHPPYLCQKCAIMDTPEGYKQLFVMEAK